MDFMASDWGCVFKNISERLHYPYLTVSDCPQSTKQANLSRTTSDHSKNDVHSNFGGNHLANICGITDNPLSLEQNGTIYEYSSSCFEDSDCETNRPVTSSPKYCRCKRNDTNAQNSVECCNYRAVIAVIIACVWITVMNNTGIFICVTLDVMWKEVGIIACGIYVYSQ
jgi:hypothetical protein